MATQLREYGRSAIHIVSAGAKGALPDPQFSGRIQRAAGILCQDARALCARGVTNRKVIGNHSHDGVAVHNHRPLPRASGIVAQLH